MFSEEHADVAARYNNLGSVHADLGQYNEAKQYHEKALTIREKVFGEEHPHLKASYRNLRNLHYYLRQRNQTRRKNCILL